MNHTPFFKIFMLGENQEKTLGSHIGELRYNDRQGSQADSLEIEIADNPRVISWPSEGADLSVQLGYVNGVTRTPSQFSIDQIGHSGPPSTLVVSATSADFTSAARAPRERTHRERPGEPLTMLRFITELASQYGAEARVVPDELARLNLKYIDQAGQSDLSLAWEVARSHDAMFKPVDGIWFVRSYEAIGEPTLTIRPGDVTSHRAHFIARKRYASVRAHYHNFDTARRVPVIVGEGEPQLVLDDTFPDEDVAYWQAKAAMGRSRRDARRLTLSMPGRPDIYSQQVIRLEGFRERVDDAWLVTEVVHTINKRGYRCRVECTGV